MPEFDSSLEFRFVVGQIDYKVGTDGSVWSRRPHRHDRNGEWRRLKPLRGNKFGHLSVTITGRGRVYIHQLVLEAFAGPCPPGMEARHFPDRDPSNNRLENLSYATRAINLEDRRAHGTMNIGERNGTAVLTADKVREMRAKKGRGVSIADITREYGVSYRCGYAAITGETWKHVT